jgi:predicted  nucleic acid-binding Zn-ribbon protein
MPLKARTVWLAALAILAAASVTACRSTYYALWEQVGKEKRHLLRDEVESVRDDQAKASEEFKDALTRVKELTGFSGGELEEVYDRLKADHDDCRRRAGVIDERMANIERIAADLFAEWEGEIGQITRAEFQSRSRQQLTDTRTRYQRLQRSLSQARSRMDPVLTRLNDYVLYLKHNLNARAVGALGQEMGRIESDVAALVQDIERAVLEADTFLENFEG